MKTAYKCTVKIVLVSLMLSLALLGGTISGAEEPTIIIGNCDTAVENQVLADSYTMSDLIVECANDARSHGEFLSCVAHLTNEWKKKELITGKEKGAIQRCAAKSDIDKVLDISGTWLLYLTPQGGAENGPDCFYIHQEGNWIYFSLYESSMIRVEWISIHGNITGRNLELSGEGWNHGNVSSFTLSATTDGHTITGAYTHADDFGSETGTFEAVRDECKRAYSLARNFHRTDLGYGLDFYVWDYIPEGIPFTSGTVTGPHIGTISLSCDAPTEYLEYSPWTAGSIFGETKPTAGDVYTFTVNYSDGTSETMEATVRDILVDFPTPISPVDGEIITTLTPTFSWEPPPCGCQGYYRVWVLDSLDNEVWSYYPDKDTTSIVYNFNGQGEPLNSGATYNWRLIAFDDAPPGPDNYTWVFAGTFTVQ